MRASTMRATGWERGATVLEAALIAPLFFLFLFAIMDFGGAYMDSHAVRDGTRDAARQISVGNTGGSESCTLITPSGSPAAREAMCLVKESIGLPDTDLRVRISVESEGYAVDKTVKICAQFPVRSLSRVTAPFLEGPSRVFQTAVQIEIEQIAAADIVGSEPEHVTWDCSAVET